MLFDSKFGRTGGEDVDFFRRLIVLKRKLIVWNDEASVHEVVPEHRMTRIYFIKRALLRGAVSSKSVSVYSMSTVKSALAFVLYTIALPVLLLAGHRLFMKYLIKDCDHIGKLFAFIGITIIKERSS
jgi:hypothetical protein